jgi:hypothetical protein
MFLLYIGQPLNFYSLNKMIMRQRISSLGLILAALVLLLVSCDKKTEEVDELVGTYVFASASFNDTVYIIIQDNQVEFLPGSDAAAFVGPGLLSSAPCENPQNAAIELSSDGKANYACLNETNKEQMGVWSINADRTILTLTLSNPAPFALTISGLEITANSFSGTVENFPLPINAGYDLGAMLPGAIINYQVASVDLTFNRVP